MRQEIIGVVDKIYEKVSFLLDSKGVQGFLYACVRELDEMELSYIQQDILTQIVMDLHDSNLLDAQDTYFTEQDLMYDLDKFFPNLLIPPVFVEATDECRRVDTDEIDDRIPVKPGTLRSTFINYMNTHEKQLLSCVSEKQSNSSLSPYVLNYAWRCSWDKEFEKYIIRKVGKDRLREILQECKDETPEYIFAALWPEEEFI